MNAPQDVTLPERYQPHRLIAGHSVDDRRTGQRSRIGSSVGLRSVFGIAGGGSFSDPVHGTGRVAHRSGAPLQELSPDSVRGFLPGFAYQCGVLLASSVAYVETIFAQHTSYANAMALTAFVVFTLAAVVVALGREQKGIQFGS